MRLLSLSVLCVAVFVLILPQAQAFGAGNIASISTVEGRNWRHGDIEDTLKGLAHLRGYKWSSMNIKRVYFGNWLRDYSQAVDVGSLKGVPAETIRLLLWVLAFMTFGYCTAEFEVTAERLGCYRPEGETFDYYTIRAWNAKTTQNTLITPKATPMVKMHVSTIPDSGAQ